MLVSEFRTFLLQCTSPSLILTSWLHLHQTVVSHNINNLIIQHTRFPLPRARTAVQCARTDSEIILWHDKQYENF